LSRLLGWGIALIAAVTAALAVVDVLISEAPPARPANSSTPAPR
jgi:hypothetical protein